MVKLDYNWKNFITRTYFAHDFSQPKDIGCRLSYEKDSFVTGVAFFKENFEEEEKLLHYEFDVAFSVFNNFELSSQISNIDDGQDATDDIRAYFLSTYSSGYKLPVMGNSRPYVGIDTRKDMKEYYMFFGLNFEPISSAFLKIEYGTDSSKLIDDRFDIQVAYIF